MSFAIKHFWSQCLAQAVMRAVECQTFISLLTDQDVTVTVADAKASEGEVLTSTFPFSVATNVTDWDFASLPPLDAGALGNNSETAKPTETPSIMTIMSLAMEISVKNANMAE